MPAYYLQFFSPHGLIRFKDPEIGRDKDTGGQTKYVLELLERLSRHPRIRKVDLFTRRIVDKRVSGSYQREIEIVNDKARIIRINCGGTGYLPKEVLWDHLDEFVNKTIHFIENQKEFPDVVHGHYADGIYLASQVSQAFGIPFIATGHSLGRNKEKILLQQGLTPAKINEKFNMLKRIAVEEQMLADANAIVVGTQYEIDHHYHLYENKEKGKFTIIPPGVNTEIFFPFYRLDLPAYKMSIEQEQAIYRINGEIERFLFNPAKPLILSIGRADKRKNFETIIQSFGRDKELQTMANLAIFPGVRKDISAMPEDEKDILTRLLLLMDKYDLYGKMAIPKKNDPRLEVPEIYRLAARKKGVFVNATPGENFGLTIVESAACGLPVIASPTGGPKEILTHCNNGLLVNVDDPTEISQGIKKIIADQALWEKFSSNGVVATNQLYSWEAHCALYIHTLEEVLNQKQLQGSTELQDTKAFGKKLIQAKQFIISDLDGTLVDGNMTDGLLELYHWIQARRDAIVFGIASGRSAALTQQALVQYQLPSPDILICAAGSEMYYTEAFIPDYGWEKYIDYKWKRAELMKTLLNFPGLALQEEAAQRKYKLSYYVDNTFNEDKVADLYQLLDNARLRAQIVFIENKFLDLLPYRASKGSAVKYLSYKWKIPLNQFITAGKSGDDKDMLVGKTKGIVVANYSPEMEELKNNKFVYFTKNPLSKGVLEGIQFYNKDQP